MVRLKVKTDEVLSYKDISFNSTMVRLKVKTDEVLSYKDISFNSTMVRLKVKTDEVLSYKDISFNSTMVRLKDEIVLAVVVEEFWFQFHNGSIKRNSDQTRWRKSSDVSIPQWFD